MGIITKPELPPSVEYYDMGMLQNQNVSYHHQHGLKQYDLNKVNRLIDCIHSQIGMSIRGGDRCKAIGKNSNGVKTYTNALIEKISDYYGDGVRRVSLCTQPYVPFTTEHNGSISCSASGGYWLSESNFRLFKHIGFVKGRFCTWGHCGATGNGAVEFETWVNYWEYQNLKDIY